MTKNAVLDVFRASPWRPFTLRMTSGEWYHVPHVDYLFMVPGDDRTVIVALEGGHFRILDVALIEAIEQQKEINQ